MLLDVSTDKKFFPKLRHRSGLKQSIYYARKWKEILITFEDFFALQNYPSLQWKKFHGKETGERVLIKVDVSFIGFLHISLLNVLKKIGEKKIGSISCRIFKYCLAIPSTNMPASHFLSLSRDVDCALFTRHSIVKRIFSADNHLDECIRVWIAAFYVNCNQNWANDFYDRNQNDWRRRVFKMRHIGFRKNTFCLWQRRAFDLSTELREDD